MITKTHAKLPGGSLAKRCKNQEQSLNFSLFCIENWNMFHAKLLGGSLAKRCRNQEVTLAFFSPIFHWKLQHVSRCKIRGKHGKFRYCKLKHFSLKIAKGLPSKTLQKSGGDIGIFSILHWKSKSVFHPKLLGGSLPNAAEIRRKHWKFLYPSLEMETFFTQNCQGVASQNVGIFLMLHCKLHDFLTKLLGGSLAKRCRNQE